MASSTTIFKSERFEAKLPKETKDIIAKASILSGQNMSDFVVNTAFNAAIAIINNYDIIRLNAEKQKEFAENLLNSPKPNEKLVDAFKWYDEQ